MGSMSSQTDPRMTASSSSVVALSLSLSFSVPFSNLTRYDTSTATPQQGENQQL